MTLFSLPSDYFKGLHKASWQRLRVAKWLMMSAIALNSVSATIGQATTSPSATLDIRKAMTMTLRQFYGNQFHLRDQCFLYDYQDNHYCMQIVKADVKPIGQDIYLYLMASSDVTDESAGHAASGLNGLFVLQQFGGNWQVVASNPTIDNGQWGESQLKDFKLMPVGPHTYGWVGELGGSGAGGESSSDWTMFAPINNQIKEVASEEIAHDYTGDHWHSVEGSVTVLQDKKPMNGFYPLQVKRVIQTAPTDDQQNVIKSKIETVTQNYQLIFNPKKGKFVAK